MVAVSCMYHSKVCSIIGTIAFGMEIQLPDISMIIHGVGGWGGGGGGVGGRRKLSWTIDNRSVRLAGMEYLFIPRRSMHSRMVDDDMRKIVANSHDECIRKTVLLHLQLTRMTTEDILSCRGRSNYCSPNTVIILFFN